MNNFKICIGHEDNCILIEQAPDLDIILKDFEVDKYVSAEGWVNCSIYINCRALQFKIHYKYYMIYDNEDDSADEYSIDESQCIRYPYHNGDYLLKSNDFEIVMTPDLHKLIEIKKSELRTAYNNLINDKSIKKDQYEDELKKIFQSN